MTVYYGTEQIQNNHNAVVTAGTFDGVHIGHCKILSRLREAADKIGGETVVITYHPHPRLVLPSEKPGQVKLLTTLEEKTELLHKEGIDKLVIIPFTLEFASKSSDAFVREILVDKIGTRLLVIGHDHKFGRNREGGFEYLRDNAGRYGFEVEEIPAQDIEEVTVSSTRIRHALENGNLETANEYLGRPYSLCGTVIHGKAEGRKLGYPTANLQLSDKNKLIPAEGVYACKADCNGEIYNALLSIGTNPVFGDNPQTIEAWLMDFDGDLYGKNLRLNLHTYLREQKKFESLEALIDAMKADEKRGREILSGVIW
ncbi:MAG: bifunctional riboflavin kinase/FAD synthetase [Bacteroidota bacterium]